MNHLATCGETLDEAFDCFAGYLHWLQKDEEIAPEPSPIDKVDLTEIARELDIECGESFVSMIIVDVTEYAKMYFKKSVKKTLTIPVWLNNAAVEQDVDFSQVLQEALKERLHVG